MLKMAGALIFIIRLKENAKPYGLGTQDFEFY